MVSQFELVIVKLGDLGVLQFILPFLLTAAIFYGLLRKSKVFGDPRENVSVNAIISMVAGFMVWAYPVVAGIDILEATSKFFFQGTIAMLAVMMGIMISGMFLPSDLPKEIGRVIKTGKGIGIILGLGLIIALVIFITSGLVELVIPNFGIGGFGGGAGTGIDDTTLLSMVVVIVMGLVVVGLTWGTGKGSKD